MSFSDLFKTTDAAEAERQRQISAAMRRDQFIAAIKRNRMPDSIHQRLGESRDGKVPWIATLTPAELLIVRSHGVRPIAAVSASCWLHYGWSWTNGHREGWQAALRRLRDEAKAAGANAVLDVKMRTVPMYSEESMDFTLIGTAVKVDRLSAAEPIVATVPALEFVKLLDMGIIPTGIAIGAEYLWLTWQGSNNVSWAGNTEVTTLSKFWAQVRGDSLRLLRTDAQRQGNGCLAHIHFSQMFKFSEGRYLARNIVIGTVIQSSDAGPIRDDIRMCVNMGQKPLTNPSRHHQSYETTDKEEAI